MAKYVVEEALISVGSGHRALGRVVSIGVCPVNGESKEDPVKCICL
jgi:hypothetical protein